MSACRRTYRVVRHVLLPESQIIATDRLGQVDGGGELIEIELHEGGDGTGWKICVQFQGKRQASAATLGPLLAPMVWILEKKGPGGLWHRAIERIELDCRCTNARISNALATLGPTRQVPGTVMGAQATSKRSPSTVNHRRTVAVGILQV
jgi:hypothetical protein